MAGPRSSLTKREKQWLALKKRLGTSAETHEDYMRMELEKRWSVPVVKYTCVTCLEHAFNDSEDYISDEDLIACSNGHLGPGGKPIVRNVGQVHKKSFPKY